MINLCIVNIKEKPFPAFSTLVNPSKLDSVVNPETGLVEVLQFDITDWRKLELEKVMWAPIPYSPDRGDRYNREYVSPFDEQRYKNSDNEIVAIPTA